jgi:3-methyladenine DNA glycosylase AlkD
MDEDDMVQKGYGWLLKVASKLNQKKVFEFVYARRLKMPRTALRYAIEKMPESLRKKAMSR